MNDNPQHSRKNKINQQGFNGWKWAFLGLVALIIGLFMYLGTALQPVTVNEANTETVEQSDEVITLSTSLNRADTEAMINAYLNDTVGEDFSRYQVTLTNQLEIHGTVEVFGFEAPFSLYFDPYVLENGNIQLRGDSVELANFALPVSGVMSLFAQQVDLPTFIAVDSEKELVVINLSELTEDFSFDVAMDKIDLADDLIRLNLFLNQGTISDNIQQN